jgi:hypothetical protein
MIDDDPTRDLDALREEIMRATERRLARAREGFDTTAIRGNNLPKKSRKTSVFHRAIH